MLQIKKTVRPLAIVALLLGLAGCHGDEDYFVACGRDYCSWFVGTHLVAVADVNDDSFKDLAISDPWPGP